MYGAYPAYGAYLAAEACSFGGRRARSPTPHELRRQAALIDALNWQTRLVVRPT
jgi:hypothetical protein